MAEYYAFQAALGTDNIFDPQTTNWREFELLVKAGLSPMDAIVALAMAWVGHVR